VVPDNTSLDDPALTQNIELLLHLFGPCPGITWDARNERGEYLLEASFGRSVIEFCRFRSGKKRPHILQKGGIRKLGEHPALGLRAPDFLPAVLEIEHETLDDSGVIESWEDVHGMSEIEQISALVALEERTELGGE
jgi:hypothetical protein